MHADRKGRCTPDNGERCACRTFTARLCKNAGQSNGRCRLHGGGKLAAMTGTANPAFKHGRYSKVLPGNLQGRYHEALADAELLSMRDEVAVLEARIAELLEVAAPSSTHWRAAVEAFEDMRRANASGRQADLAVAVGRLDTALRAGATAVGAWDDLGGLMERKRRLARDEVRRLSLMGQMITAERAMVLVAALTDAVQRHVLDLDARRRIADDFARLLSAAGRTAAEG